jgi:uncharacterized protein
MPVKHRTKLLQACVGRGRLAHLLLACFIAAGAVGCSADSLVMGENRQAVDPGAARRQVVSAQGRSIECWVVRSPGAARREPTAFVLMLEGKGGRAEQWIGEVAQSWGQRPVEVWGMNYPGFGGSDGPARMVDVVPAALAVFDTLKQTAGERPVFVHGASFGTAPALAVAARRPVGGLLLWNPPPLRELILGNYGWWNLGLAAGPVAARVPHELDSLDNASRSIAPAVFVLAGADEIIPPAYQRRVVDAYLGPERLIEMPGAHHADPLPREAAVQLSEGMDWLLSRASAVP